MGTVPEPVMDRLRCPRCGHGMVEDFERQAISCSLGHLFARRDGYLDLSRSVAGGSTGRTFASFGYEWNAFDDVRDEDGRFADVYFRDLDLASLEGKLVLDAGCGKGRFTRFLAAHAGALVALDGSEAVRAAARNLSDDDNVVVVRSDLRDAPFAPESFDFISSLGVLHHLDDPRAGFTRLLTYLAPGGRILLYIYSRPPRISARSVGLTMAGALRTVTVGLPHRALRAVSGPIAGILYLGVVAPGRWGEGRGIAALARLPMSAYRDKPFRSLVLDTFDRLSAPVEHRYVWKELRRWFEDTGLIVDAVREETGWFILAHRI